MRAFVFPGQGSQYVGMGKDLPSRNPLARAMYDRADELLGFKISGLCFQGPDDELRQTKNTQPAIFLHSVVLSSLVAVKASMAAGHSLGEYSALVYAKALSFEDALSLVRLRGELMQRAGVEQPGTMAAVVGLERDVVAEVCSAAEAEGVVRPANFNSPGQIVISGSVAGVRKAMELARSRGARLVKELSVSGAFHSPLMGPARDGLKRALDAAEIRDAEIPVYANVTGNPVRTAVEIREALTQQLTSPVRWQETIEHMSSDGASEFVELGPGKVLQGLVKRTVSATKVSGVDTYADLTLAGV